MIALRGVASSFSAPFAVARRGTSGQSTLAFETEESGAEGTLGWRMHFKRKSDGKRVSPWHTIPLWSSGFTGDGIKATGGRDGEPYAVNMVVEMPRGTRRKMEIQKTEVNNPIAQDTTKTGCPRSIRYGPVLHHYGSAPQTWEDPSLGGDNDPVDIIDIGATTAKRGDVRRVRVLGALALVDCGEMDWKVIAVDEGDTSMRDVTTVGDLMRARPGTIRQIREWYRRYKTADGKPENQYAFGGRALGRDKAMSVLEESNANWKSLQYAKSKHPSAKEFFLE